MTSKAPKTIRSLTALLLGLTLTVTAAGCQAAGANGETGNPAAGASTEVSSGSTAGTPAQTDITGEIPELMPAVLPEENAAPAGQESSAAPAERLPLKELYQDQFRIGVAVQAIDHWHDKTAEIGNPAKEALIDREFNSMTFGNEWKPAYNFDADSPTLYKTDPAAEELLIWAKEHQMPVRGHTLVWHSQCNPNIFAKDFRAVSKGSATTDWKAELDPDCLVDASTLIKRLRTYIRGLMEYTYANGFADTVYAFDVINEATEEKNADGLRDSYYYRIIGPQYLYYCFLFAREAELDYAAEYASLYGLDASKDDLSPILPKLFYNDYNEWFPKRVSIITRFLTEDVFNEGQKMIASPAIAADGDGTIAGDGLIDGIGMQGHLDDTQNIDQYIDAMRAYDAIVDEVQITELDVGETASGELAETKQAAFCNEFFRRLLEEHANGVHLTCVTWWGLTDDASWRKGANPLLYHHDLSEKPAYEALQMAFRGEVYDAANPISTRDATELLYDFEPRTEDGKLLSQEPEDLGLTSRGTGHQSVLRIVKGENHTENAPIGRSLRVTREEQDATVRLDISRFIGKTIRIRLFVKTADSEVTLGATGDSDLTLAAVPAGDDWTAIEAACRLNDGLSSAALWLETDGSTDLYIDDISIQAE